MAWTIKSQERYEDQVESYLNQAKNGIASAIQLAETQLSDLSNNQKDDTSLRGIMDGVNSGLEALKQARHMVEQYPNEAMESSLFSTPLEGLSRAAFDLEVRIGALLEGKADPQKQVAFITKAVEELKAQLEAISKIWVPQFFTQPGEGLPQEYETGMWGTMKKIIRNLEQSKEKSKTELLNEEIYGVPGIKWKFRKPRRMILPPHSQQSEREREKRSVPKKFF